MSTTNTSIQWTDATWSPVRGCSRVSAGCDHCYAMGMAHRFSGEGKPYEGLTRIRKSDGKVDWSGVARFIPEALDQPLRWKRPRRIFVNSMSDLFHESLTNEQIAAVFGVMAAAPQHTFQVLTKRPQRMREWFQWAKGGACGGISGRFVFPAESCRDAALSAKEWRLPDGSMPPGPGRALLGYDRRWPLPNVHLGVSIENQKTADERIPLLLDAPAEVRFVSYEPALEPVHLGFAAFNGADSLGQMPGLHWVIVGGESGPGARPFDIQIARDVINECKAAGVACFIKQLGAHPFNSDEGIRCDGGPNEWAWLNLQDRKGADMAEWPEDLRVREMPGGRP